MCKANLMRPAGDDRVEVPFRLDNKLACLALLSSELGISAAQAQVCVLADAVAVELEMEAAGVAAD